MLMFDRRLLAHFDLALLVLTLAIAAVGFATIVSATYSQPDLFSTSAVRQLAWSLLGLVAMFGMLFFDYKQLERYAYVIYGAGLVLLSLVPVAGSVGGGSRRWLSLGPMSIQPSELMKIALVIALARLLQTRVGDQPLTLRTLGAVAVLIAAPGALIMAQPDLGTALLIAFVGASILLLAGLRLRWVLVAVAVVGPLLPPIWSHLKPYQQRRILTFLDPQADPLGAGYHVIQSEIAIGSGGWSGKGYLRGTQNHLNFLPEQHTDFIFSVFAEEWGFLGCCLLLVLYLCLVGRGLVVASRAKDNFGMLLAFGVTCIVFWQVFINVGMASGLLPVVGITLPMLSYGGSSLIALMMGLGVVMNVSMRRFTF
jgi:rod shape determining protein RodA